MILNRGVKVIFGLVRMKVKSLRLKFFVKFLLPVFIGLLVSIIGQSSMPPIANALYFGTGYNAAVAGNAGGGNQNGVSACATDMVAVGVGLTVNGNSPGFGIYCRAIGPDGQLVAQDQSSATNTTAVGGGTNKIFCPVGEVVTGISFIVWSNVRIRCATPPSLSDGAQTAWALAATGTEQFTNCTTGIVAGFYTRTGAWTDAIGAYCLPYTLNTLSYNVNGGSGTAPASQTQTVPGQLLVTASTYAGTRTGFHLDGWNTLANGLGDDYAVGSNIRPVGATTLYAKWTSTISYNGNTNTGGAVPNSTTAVSSAAITNLAPNSGNLVKTGFTFGGWNTAANGSGTTYLASNPNYASTGDVTLYAQWNSTITYNGNGQTSLATTVPAATIATGTDGNTTLAAPTTLLRTNFTFDGWNTAANGSGTSYAAGLTTYASTGSTTLYAQWKAPITFNGNTNSGGTAPATVNAITSTITLPSNSGNLTKTGYAFSGWNTAANGSGTTYAAGATYSVNGTATLYAYWTPDNTGLTPSFNTNTNSPIGVLASTAYVINTAYTNNVNDLVLSQYADKIQIIASVPSGTLAITTTTNLALPIGYQTALNTAAATISFIGNLTDVNAALATLKYTAPATAVSTTITITAAYAGFNGDYRYNPTAPVNYSSLFPALTRTIAVGALVAPGTPTLDSASDSGSSNSDKITNDNTPTINVGGLTVGATVTLTATPASGTPVTCSFVATTTTGTCTFTTMLDGTYSIVATQTLGGTTTAGSTALANVQINTVRPTVTLSSTVASGANDLIALNTAITNYTITVRFSESVSGFLISEITKDAASTGWSVGTTLSGSGASYTFTTTNSGVLVNDPGKLMLRIAEGVATDVAGNTNTATTSDFVLNSVARVDFSDCGPIGQYCTGGTGPASLTQASLGASITLPGPNTLYRTGYSFAGWGVAINSSTVLTGSYTPTTRIILIPQWTPSVYVVTYDANGGNGAPTEATKSFTFGTSAISLTTKGTLTKTGYTFAGWNTLATGLGTNYLENANYSPTASIILYAKWTANSYTLSYNANGGTTNSSTSITAGTAVTLSTTAGTKTGFTLAGWNTAADGTGTSYAGATSQTFYSDVTLYALWRPASPGAPSVSAATAGNTTATVTVTGVAASGTTVGPAVSYSVQAFASDGTTVITGKTCTVLASASPLSCDITGLTNGTTYKFKAAAINASGSTTGVISTVTAIPAPYLVTYSLNSGTLTPGTANYNLGTPLTLPLPTRSGYSFAGWYAESGLTTLVGNDGAPYSPSAATTLYAKWTGVVYTITYNGNGSSGGTVPASGSYTNGGTAYPVVDNTGVLTKTGYTFAGWYTTATGTGGTAYAAAAPYSSAANIILFAKWSPIARTVTYALNSGSGTIPAQLTGKFIGDTFSTSVATGFSRSGYSFTGWSDGTSIYAANSTYTVAGSDVVLTAQWAAVSYSVTFLSNGATSGAAPTQANLTAGQTFTTPANPFTKDGFNFTGWNDGTNNYLENITYTMTAANTVLVAQWTARGYAITYNGNTSDGGSAPTAGNYVTGSPAYSVALNTFTKTGHVFTGWTTAADGTGTEYAAGSGYSSTADLVLYAQWAPASYTISYNGNGANNGTAPTKSSESWTYSSTTPLTLSTQGNLAKTGYTFGGWATTANAAVGVTTATPIANTTYFAVWTPTQFTVTYEAGVGSGNIASPGNKTLGQTFTLETGSSLTPPLTVNNVSYSFGYWSDGTKIFKGGATYVMPADNVILTANWIAIYNVTYNPNGGTTTNTSVQLADTNPLTIGSAATRIGYTFVKWQDQSNALWNPGETTTVTATRFIFSAQWSANTNTITYNGNSNTGGSVPTPGSYVTDGAPYVVLGNIGSLVRAGYTFVGWNTAANGSGTDYPAGVGTTYSLPDNVILYAKWQPGVYTVTYNGNGATGGATPSNGSFTTGGSYSIPANSVGNLAKAGFSFAGWSTAANGGGTSYADAATTLTTTSDVILYANWSAASYAVTYVLNGATSALPTQSAVQYGSTFTLAAAATQTGKNFIGWSDGTNTYGGGSTYTMGTVAVTLTASWQDQVYAITYALNGGSGSAPVQSGLANGGTFTVATTSSTKAGYTFAGWNNGTSNVSTGTTYTITANNVTLTAVWTIAAPAAPGTVSAAGGDGSATITVAPSSSGGAPTSYVVTASPAPGTCTVISPATSCVILGITNGTAYTFSATATNSTGTSTAATSAAVTPAGKPDAPTGVNAVSGNGSATVSFTAPTVTGGAAIASYTVTASPNGAICTVNAPATSCVVSGLTNGTAYTFAVTANNGLLTSSASTASSSVVPATVPGAPTSVAATSSASGAATVTFTAPTSNGGSAITGYTVTSSPAGATCTGSGTTYTCTGLTNGTSYTFAVVAINGVGNSAAGTTSSGLTTQGAASAPTTISAATGDGEATVTFSGAVANGSTITGYTVKAYDSTGNEVSGATCTVTTAAANGSCIVTGLTNGSSYTFKAITNSTANGAPVTSALSIATTAITPAKAPDAPTGVQVTAGTGKISVSWTEPASNGSAILSYTVQAYGADGIAIVGATCTATAPSTTCDVSTNLTAGSNYTFKVIATSLAGSSAASSASSSAAINAAPSAPRNVAGTPGNATVAVVWDAPTDIRGAALTGYTATAYTSGNNVAGTCTSTVIAEACTVTGLTNGTAYTFKVVATNGIGTSVESTASSAVTPSTVPNAPTGVTVAADDGTVAISFTAPSNNGGSTITGYTVTASNGATISGTSSPLTIAGLTNGTAYTFTVKAENANGQSVASSTSSSATPVLSSAPTLANPGQPTGDPYVGSTLTSNVTFNGSPTPTVTYQWKVCTDPLNLGTCTNISSATSATYVPTISELGKYIVVAATATNRVGNLTETSNPTLVINPEIAFSAPSSVPNGTVGTAYVLSMAAAGGVGTFGYTISSGTLPAGVVIDPATGQIAGTPTTSGTFTFTVRAIDSNGVYKDVAITIVVAAAAVTQPVTTPTTPTEPQPLVPTCDADCQAAKEAAATKAAADKAAADAAVVAKAASDAAATTASTKATADAAAAAAAAKAAVDKAAAAAVAQAAADAAAAAAAAQAKAAANAQAAATKAAADAAAALKNSTTTAAAKAAATKSANDAADAAAAAVKAAATAASDAAKAKTTAANATKQVVIVINSLNSKTAAALAKIAAEANAVAAAAKAAANEAAAAAATKATEAKAAATTAQKAASDTAARIATEQKQAADAAALAKIAADAAVKATAKLVAAVAAATKASQDLATVLAEKATLAAQAAKATDQTARAEIQTKIDEVATKVEEVQKTVEAATTKADAAVAVQATAVQTAKTATKEATTQAAEAVAVKAESVTKTAEATKAAAAATVAAKVALAAKEAAAKVPS